MEKVAKFIILACILINCTEIEKPRKPFFKMTVSNALPIQFWVNGQDTFNEKDVCGMTSVCWCQPFQCTDEIRIQFTDSISIDAELGIYDTNDSLITSINFDRTTVIELELYRYDLVFTPQENGICNEQVSFKINKTDIITITEEHSVYDFQFATDLDGWFNTIDGINPDSSSPPIWVHSADDGGSLVVNQSNTMSTAFSNLRKSSISLPAETSFIRVKWRNNYPPNNAGLTLSFSILDASNAYVTGFPANLPAASNSSIQTFAIGIISSAVWLNADSFLIGVAATSIPTDNLDVIHLESVEVYTETYEYETVRTELAKSDCISIKESHPCTTLVNYSNNSNFDGIVYADQSPNLDFNLRIPAIFFEEQNTKESEDIELSSDEIVRLYDKIEEKRELRVGFMPHYMHRKLLLSLSHDFVIIDDKDWLLRDEYKKNEGNRHYPLRTATVLLTDKNFIKENQL